MDELIMRSLQGAATQADEGALRQWRARAPENEERYREISEIWSLTIVADPIRSDEKVPDFGPWLEPSEPQSLRAPDVAPRGAAKVWKEAARKAKGGSTGRRLVTGALAASLVAVGFGLGLLAERDRFGEGWAGTELVTGAGEMTTLTMADGQTVRLGPTSRLQLTHQRDATVARLEGRAFFGVAPDGNREFRVLTQHGEARVLGTRFEVRSEGDEFRVLVVEGEVVATAGDSHLGLTEGEMGRANAGGVLVRSAVEDVHEQLAWIGRTLVFRSTPLFRAARDIEHLYGVRVMLDEALTDLDISVTFTDASLEEAVLVICGIIRARCVVEDDRVEIRRAVQGVGGGSGY